MVCVASDGQGTIEIWDDVGDGAETLKISQSVRVADLVSRVCRLHNHKIGSVAMTLQWDGNKVDLTNVRQDRTIAEIGVDFTSETTYVLHIGKWITHTEDSDEQNMPCLDGSELSFRLRVTGVTAGNFAPSNLEIVQSTRVNDLFRLIERTREPGTFGLFLRSGLSKKRLEKKDTRKLTEIGVDFKSPDKVMLLVTEPPDSPATTPPTDEKRRDRRRDKVEFEERIQERGEDDVESNRRSENVYVGLVNQAMTCYLNSLLQALYMTPEFRNALYNWEYVNDPGKDEALSIPYQLQKLFLNLQTSSKYAIETTSLTKSFGWDSTQAWQQHDIQELCRVMFDALEQKFKNTEQADLINRLYEGKMMDYVKCLECSTEKSREDTFLDIPLPVRPFGSTVAYNNVEEALNAFVQPETLDGTNQYHCDTCNKKCDAHKGLKFTKFPYLLTLHLKRFDFDYNTFHRIKLNDEVTFPDVLNLNSFIPSPDSQEAPCNEEDAGVGVKCDDGSTTTDIVQPDEKSTVCDNGLSSTIEQTVNHDRDDDSGIDLSNGPSSSSCSTHNHESEKNRGDRNETKGPYVYELFSIMIHSGSASGGHYYAYIKDFRTGEWLCFNDQNVSPITYDDIQKTYGGGPTRAYYSGVYSSSTNAYMLMYRQIDPVRNSLPMQVKDFPKHLQELLLKMQDNNERTYHDYSSSLHRVPIFRNNPTEKTLQRVMIRCTDDQTWRGLTNLVCQMWPDVPRDRARLVTYCESTGMIECSFEGREDETFGSILGEPRDLLLEIRDKNETFKPCLPGGVMSKVFVVDVAKKQVVKGPINVRGLMTQTVADYKTQLSELIGIEPKDINLILQHQNYMNAKLITNDDNQLKDENFICGDKIFVPTSFDTSTSKSIDDGIYELTKIFAGLTWLNIELPETSEDILRQLSIPSLEEKIKEKAVEPPLRNGPTKPCTTTVTDASTDVEKSETNDAQTTKSGVTEESSSGRTETSPLTVQTESEDWHTPEQCNSEDSSLSYSDRTLVGEGDASEDDDYPLGRNDHTFFHHTEEETWDIEDPKDYYFQATTQPDNSLCVLLDRQMSVGTLKKLLEPYVGVPMQYFKVFPTTDRERDLTRLAAPLSFLKDGMTLQLKLGRVLSSNEIKINLHLLTLDVEDKPYRFLCTWIVNRDATIGQTKKEIVVHLKKKFDIDIPYERCRLRRKYKKIAQNVFLDDQKFNDIHLRWPYDVIVQKLPGKEPVTDPNDVLLFARRIQVTVGRLGPIEELVVSGKSITEVREKLSESSGIPEENLEIAKGESCLPGDMMLLVLRGLLDWNRKSMTSDNCPEIDLENGVVLYYRDSREKPEEPSGEDPEAKGVFSCTYKSITKPRMFGNPSSSSRYSPRRERALKIYIDDK